MSFQDHFSAGARQYAASRPTYPPELFRRLAEQAPGRSLAWDGGTGNGQAARGLADHFAKVHATDPGQKQIDEAIVHPRIEYACSAETAPSLTTSSVDLITSAQAVHWFDRQIFFQEAERLLVPNGLIAVWCYELCFVDPDIDHIVSTFYSDPLGPFWPPERRLVETGYRDMEFPFAELPFPEIVMEQEWSVDQFTAYLATWSAVKRFRECHLIDPVYGREGVAEKLAILWRGPRRVRWPVSGRWGVRKG